MQEVADTLFVGADHGCRSTKHSEDDWAVVHACKHPCHQNAVGGQVSSNHPNYLVLEEETDLYLNMVDMDRKQQHQFMEPMISATLDFVEQHLNSKQILFHCNQGQSRSPCLAMLYLAKRANKISDKSYEQASIEFRELYPNFNPGRGIHLYLQDYWNQLE